MKYLFVKSATFSFSLVIALLLVQTVSADRTADRLYLMGEHPDEFPSEGASPFTTNDSAFDAPGGLGDEQFLDDFDGNVVYTNVGPTGSARPGAAAGDFGLLFNGASFMQGARLGLPSTTESSNSATGPHDYSGIANRGFQLWVRPGASGGTLQDVVMDTDQHGVRISDAAGTGTWVMHYAGQDFDSGLDATVGQWYHIMVVRPNGPANGAVMYVDGTAVAAAPGGYNGGDDLPLVLGANTGDDGSDPNTPDIGTQNFFTGTMDNLEMFVLGSNNAEDYGTFDPSVDNEALASLWNGVAGDLNQDGVLNQSDKDDFIAGWMSEHLVMGVRAGDLNSLTNGDLNFDGTTGIDDLVLMQNAIAGAGLAAITADDLSGASAVPEPASASLLLLAGVACFGMLRARYVS